MIAHHKVAAYKKIHVNTASPGRRIVMLYDATLKHLKESLNGFTLDATEGYEVIHNGIQAATQILLELKLALDLEQGGEVAHRLNELYQFWLVCLSDANMAKDRRMVEEVAAMVTEVREGWEEALRVED